MRYLEEGRKIDLESFHSSLDCLVYNTGKRRVNHCFHFLDRVLLGHSSLGIDHKNKKINDIYFYPFGSSSAYIGNNLGGLIFGNLLLASTVAWDVGKDYSFEYPFAGMSHGFKKMLVGLDAIMPSKIDSREGYYSVGFFPLINQTIYSLEERGFDMTVEKEYLRKIK